MVCFLKARDGDDSQSTSRCVLLVADQKFAISPRRAAREAALHLVQARSAYLQIASQRSPRNTGLIVDVKPRLRSPMCVGNRGANGGAPLQAARRLPGNSGVLVRPRERMPEAPGRVLQVGARESKGRTLPHKKTELSLRFFFCRMPDRDQRREDPAASLLAGADFSVFSFSPLSVGGGLASLCGCASFDPV